MRTRGAKEGSYVHQERCWGGEGSPSHSPSSLPQPPQFICSLTPPSVPSPPAHQQPEPDPPSPPLPPPPQLISSLSLELDSLEKRLQEASKGRESRLRNAGVQGWECAGLGVSVSAGLGECRAGCVQGWE